MSETLYDHCVRTGETALLAQWSSKNEPLPPQTVTYGSKRRVWWRCERGHEWQSVVYTARARRAAASCARAR